MAAFLDPSSRGHGHSPQARLVIVPTDGARLIASFQLNEGAIADGLAHLVREAGLAGSLAGFSASDSAGGVEITERNDRFAGEQLRVRVEIDGAIVVEGPIGGDGQMGSLWSTPSALARWCVAAFVSRRGSGISSVLRVGEDRPRSRP